MKAVNDKRSVLMRRMLIMIAAFVMLLSVIGIPAVSAIEETEDKPWSGSNAVEKPDASSIASKKGDLSDAEKKLSSSILQLTDDEFLPNGTKKGELIKRMKEDKQIVETPSISNADDSSSGLSVFVYIKMKKGSDLSKITPYVNKIENQDTKAGHAAAWVDIDAVESLAELDEVVSIQEVVAPVVYAGSRLSEGDAVHNTDDVRNQLGADGTGIKVGIISDGVRHLSEAVASGDLPNNVTVLSDNVGGDEGTAMLEIVHDLAPGAELYFHDCGNNPLAFNNAIDALVNAGCDIVCDDIGWITQPFFEDGSIAQHIDNVITTSDIIYVSSAGNAANAHYQGKFKEGDDGWHDFSGTGAASSDIYAGLHPGDELRVALQWNDAHGSSGNDYDIHLFSAGKEIAKSDYTQDGNDDPVEFVAYKNTSGSDMIITIAVRLYDAPTDKILELYAYGAYIFEDNIVKSDSIFGHAAVEDVISCGAIPQDSPSSIESFSSRGPVTMLSGSRSKPDICGVDKVAVTGVGGFGSPFYGTSAAAPHVAAIAAVLKSRFPTMSPSEIKQMMLDSAVDLGSSGYDDIFGYGRADAQVALDYINLSFDSQGGSDVDTQIVATDGKAAVPRLPIKQNYILEGWYKEAECNNEWSFGSDTVTQDTTLYAKWEDWVAQKNETNDGKLTRTHYHDNGRIDKIEEYYGGDDSTVIKKIHYYTDGLRTSYRLFDESGDLKNLIDLYDDGKTKKVNYYDTSTGIRDTYKLYDTEGRMSHFITCYGDGVKPQKTNYYNVSAGERTSYKLYDTAGRTTHLIYCHPGGVKPEKTNYYNVDTSIRTSYKLYDTQGRTTHYATCYSDGIKANKMNYYDVSTGKRTAYKTYRSDGTCSCHVVCDSDGNPSVATYYDQNGNVTKVVHY